MKDNRKVSFASETSANDSILVFKPGAPVPDIATTSTTLDPASVSTPVCSSRDDSDVQPVLSSPGKFVFGAFLQFGTKLIPLLVLLDSGADCCFVSKKIATNYKLPIDVLSDPVPLRLADGSLTSELSELATVRIGIGEHSETLSCYVTELDPYDLVLGHSWLKVYGYLCFCFSEGSCIWCTPILPTR